MRNRPLHRLLILIVSTALSIAGYANPPGLMIDPTAHQPAKSSETLEVGRPSIPKLDELESQVYHRTYPTLSPEDRLTRLEKKLFQETYTQEALYHRLDRLEMMLPFLR